MSLSGVVKVLTKMFLQVLDIRLREVRVKGIAEQEESDTSLPCVLVSSSNGKEGRDLPRSVVRGTHPMRRDTRHPRV